MKKLSQFRKEMKEFFDVTVDAEEGETFKDWFEVLLDALKEDKKIIKIGKTTYVLD